MGVPLDRLQREREKKKTVLYIIPIRHISQVPLQLTGRLNSFRDLLVLGAISWLVGFWKWPTVGYPCENKLGKIVQQYFTTGFGKRIFLKFTIRFGNSLEIVLCKDYIFGSLNTIFISQKSRYTVSLLDFSLAMLASTVQTVE